MSALITIDGVEIPTPSNYELNIEDVNRTTKNGRGSTIIQKIATKREILISYNYLTQVQLSAILTLVDNKNFSMLYMNPKSGAFETKEFYCSQKKAAALKYVNDILDYKDISFTFKEV